MIESRASFGFIAPGWREAWLTVTPIWAAFGFSRVLFYWLERLRHPEIIPPVSADAMQVALLLPLAVVGCSLILRAWERGHRRRAVAIGALTAAFVGALARPTYALASILLPENAASGAWLQTFAAEIPGPWAPWLSNALEYAVLYIASAVASVGFLTYRALMHERLLRLSVEAAAAQERLRALRAQLNPHFLFNALNSIVGLSDAHPQTARRLIMQLGDLLQCTLRASELEQHSLAEELAYLDAYFGLEEVRRPGRIRWRMLLDDSHRRKLVPALILLPLAENAVTHGLAGGAAYVDIEIEAQHQGRDLILFVRNSCPDVGAGQRPRCGGLGLRNVREQLDVLFGPDAALSTSGPTAGCFEARVRVPAIDDSSMRLAACSFAQEFQRG